MNGDDEQLVEAVIEGRLDAAAQARLRQRLDDPAFIAVLDQALNLVGALRAGLAAERRQVELQRVIARLLVPGRPEPFTDRVMQRVRRPPRGRSRRIRSPRRARTRQLLTLASLSVLALVVVAVAVVSQRPTASTEAASLLPSPAGPLVRPVLWRVLSDRDALIIGSDGASRFGRSLVEGEQLRPQAELRLRRKDGSEVSLDAQAVLRVRDGTSLHLLAGGLQAQVAPQSSRHPFVVHTAHCTVSVLGTRFRVEAQPQSSTLSVSEGLVRVSAERYERRLGAGEQLVLPGLPQSITGLALVEAPTGRILAGYERIDDGRELLLRELPNDVNFVVGVAPEIKSVRTTMRDDAGRDYGGALEVNPPFTVFGDDGAGKLTRWHLQPGRYQLRIQAFTDATGTGPPREVIVTRFTVSER